MQARVPGRRGGKSDATASLPDRPHSRFSPPAPTSAGGHYPPDLGPPPADRQGRWSPSSSSSSSSSPRLPPALFPLYGKLIAADPARLLLYTPPRWQRVFETRYFKRRAILKQRFDKMYRHPILNKKLTRQRLGMEGKGMMKGRKLGIRTPTVLLVDTETNSIIMDRVEGITVKDWLRKGKYTEEELGRVLSAIGTQVAAMHDGSLVHGDLTTSNIIIREPSLELTFIDFGLSFNTVAQNGPEDKGVDLYVMERAFLNAHADKPGLFDKALEAYSQKTNQWKSTFNRYSEVRMRGRKRSMVG